MYLLILCGPVMPCDNTDLGQHWIRQWYVVGGHKAIAEDNVELSLVRSPRFPKGRRV